MGCIYIIINLVNWKVYIGKWKNQNVEKRWNKHKNGKGSQLYCHRKFRPLSKTRL